MTRGSCLCGAVAFEITAPLGDVHHCHCSMCRKSHGTAFSTHARVPRATFRFVQGADHVRAYRSSAPCARTFCALCGARLQFLFDGLPDVLWVAVGCLDDAPRTLHVAGHMFVGSKAAWHEITDDLPRWEEYPPEP